MVWGRIVVAVLLCLSLPVISRGEVRPPVSVNKTTNVQPVKPEQFREKLEQQFRRQFSLKNVEFSVDILFPKQPLFVPKGRVGIHIPPDTMNGRTGRRAFRGAIHVDDQFEQMVNVVAEISAHSPVVVPVRFIKAREIVQPEDIQMVEVALPALQHAYVQRLDHVVGKKAMRLLPPNLPIQRSYVAEAPVIHKGDRVVLEARRGGLLVQAIGVAKESGEPGKSIAVENQSSGREVIGKVVTAGLVEVLF